VEGDAIDCEVAPTGPEPSAFLVRFNASTRTVSRAGV